MKTTIDMAREADLIDDTFASDWYVYQLKRFEALVRADQRAIDAKLCEKLVMGKHCAAAIRNRGNT